MYESPITQNIVDIASQVVQAQDGSLVYEVQKAIGYDIDKEELVRALKYDRDQYQKGYEDGRKDNGWTPVKESPKVDDYYLVTLINEYGDKFVGTAEFDPEYGVWITELDDLRSGKVIAWKPLPEPYKEEE